MEPEPETTTSAETLAKLHPAARRTAGGAPIKTSKNAQRRQQKEALAAAAERRRLKALEAMKVPKFTPANEMARRVVPDDWKKRGCNYLIFARLNGIPSEYYARLVIWCRANIGGSLGYVASEEDISAAKGINIVDLVPRLAIMPLMVCATREEAEEFIKKAGDYLDVTVQAIPFYTYSPTPSYTTGNIVHGQTEMKTFMNEILKKERQDRTAFESRAVKLYEELEEKKVAAAKARAEGKCAGVDAEPPEPEDSDNAALRKATTDGASTNMLSKVAEDREADARFKAEQSAAEQEAAAEASSVSIIDVHADKSLMTEEELKDEEVWRNDALTSETGVLSSLINSLQSARLMETAYKAKMEGFQRKAEITQRRQAKIQEAIDRVKNGGSLVSVSDSDSDSSDDEGSGAGAKPVEFVKRIIVNPAGRFKVTLQDEPVKICDNAADDEVVYVLDADASTAVPEPEPEPAPAPVSDSHEWAAPNEEPTATMASDKSMLYYEDEIATIRKQQKEANDAARAIRESPEAVAATAALVAAREEEFRRVLSERAVVRAQEQADYEAMTPEQRIEKHRAEAEAGSEVVHMAGARKSQYCHQ